LGIDDIPRLTHVVTSGRHLRVRPQMLDALEAKYTLLQQQSVVLGYIKAFLRAGHETLDHNSYTQLTGLCNQAYDLGISALDPVIAANKLRAAVADRMDAIAILRDGMARYDIAFITKGLDMVAGLQRAYPGYAAADAAAARELWTALSDEAVVVRQALSALQRDRAANVSPILYGKAVVPDMEHESAVQKSVEALLFGRVDFSAASIAWPCKSSLRLLAAQEALDNPGGPTSPTSSVRKLSTINEGAKPRTRRPSLYEQNIANKAPTGHTHSGSGTKLGTDAPSSGELSDREGNAAAPVRHARSFSDISHRNKQAEGFNPAQFITLQPGELFTAPSSRLRQDATDWLVPAMDLLLSSTPHDAIQHAIQCTSLLDASAAVDELQAIAEQFDALHLRSPLSKLAQTTVHFCLSLRRACINVMQSADSANGDRSWDQLTALMFESHVVSSDGSSVAACWASFDSTFGAAEPQNQPSTGAPQADTTPLPALHPVILSELWGIRLAWQDHTISSYLKQLLLSNTAEKMGPSLRMLTSAYHQPLVGALQVVDALEAAQGLPLLTAEERITLKGAKLNVPWFEQVRPRLMPLRPGAMTRGSLVQMLFARFIARMRLAMASDAGSMPIAAGPPTTARQSRRLSFERNMMTSRSYITDAEMTSRSRAVSGDANVEYCEPDWEEFNAALSDFDHVQRYISDSGAVAAVPEEIHIWKVVSMSRTLAVTCINSVLHCHGGICWSDVGPLPWVADPEEEEGATDMLSICTDALQSVCGCIDSIDRHLQQYSEAVEIASRYRELKSTAPDAGIFKLAAAVKYVFVTRASILRLALGRMGYNIALSDINMQRMPIKDASSKLHQLMQHCAAIFQAMAGSSSWSGSFDAARIMESVDWAQVCISVQQAGSCVSALHDCDIESSWPISRSLARSSMDGTGSHYHASRRASFSLKEQVWTSLLEVPTEILANVRHDLIVSMQTVVSQATVALLIPMLSDAGSLTASMKLQRVEHAIQNLSASTAEFEHYTDRLRAAIVAAHSLHTSLNDAIGSLTLHQMASRPCHGIICSGANRCFIERQVGEEAGAQLDMMCRCIISAISSLHQSRIALQMGDLSKCVATAITAQAVVAVHEHKLLNYATVPAVHFPVSSQNISNASILLAARNIADTLEVQCACAIFDAFLGFTSSDTAADLNADASHGISDDLSDPIGESKSAAGLAGNLQVFKAQMLKFTEPLAVLATVIATQKAIAKGRAQVDHGLRRYFNGSLEFAHLETTQRLLHTVLQQVKEPATILDAPSTGLTLKQLQQFSAKMLVQYSEGVPNLMQLRRAAREGDWQHVETLLLKSNTDFPEDCKQEVQIIRQVVAAVGLVPVLRNAVADSIVTAFIASASDSCIQLNAANIRRVLERLKTSELQAAVVAGCSAAFITDELASLLVSGKLLLDVRAGIQQLNVGKARAAIEIVKAYQARFATLDPSSSGGASDPPLTAGVADEIRFCFGLCRLLDAQSLLVATAGLMEETGDVQPHAAPHVQNCRIASSWGMWTDATGALLPLECDEAQIMSMQLALCLKQCDLAMEDVAAAVASHQVTVAAPWTFDVARAYVDLRSAWAAGNVEAVISTSKALLRLAEAHRPGPGSPVAKARMEALVTEGSRAFAAASVFGLFARIREFLETPDALLRCPHESDASSCTRADCWSRLSHDVDAVADTMHAAHSLQFGAFLDARTLITGVSVLRALKEQNTQSEKALNVADEVDLCTARLERAAGTFTRSLHSTAATDTSVDRELMTTIAACIAAGTVESMTARQHVAMSVVSQQCRLEMSEVRRLLKIFCALHFVAPCTTYEDCLAVYDAIVASSIDVSVVPSPAGSRNEKAAAFSRCANAILTFIRVLNDTIQQSRQQWDKVVLESCLHILQLLFPGSAICNELASLVHTTDSEFLRARLQLAIDTNNLQEVVVVSIQLKDLDGSMLLRPEDIVLSPSGDAIPGYHLSDRHVLHFRRHASTETISFDWSNLKLTTPFTKLGLEDRMHAITISQCLLAIGGEVSFSFPKVFAGRLATLMASSPALCREGYAQLLKQLTNNPSIESRARLWSCLHAACVFVSPPSGMDHTVEIAVRAAAKVANELRPDKAEVNPWDDLLVALYKGVLSRSEGRRSVSGEEMEEAMSAWQESLQAWLV
jgi:hypothetical protein